ncbi:MAG: LptF/LptG family permease [Brevinematia bacterium]
MTKIRLISTKFRRKLQAFAHLLWSNTKNALFTTLDYLNESIKFNKIQRYLVKQFLVAFAVSSVSLTFLGIVFNLVMDLNWFLGNTELLRKKFNYILLVYILRGPYLYSFLAPMCVLLSISYVISRMSRNFELVAIVNAGMSLKKLFAPLVLVLVITSFLYFLFLDQVVTTAGKESRYIERIKVWEDESFRESQYLENIREPIKSQNRSVTYLEIGFVSREGIMKNVKINKFFEKTGKIEFKTQKFEGGLIQHTISAGSAKWDQKINNWISYDVEIFTFNEKTELISKNYLKEYIPNFKLDNPSFFFPKKYDFHFLTLAEMNEELNKSLAVKIAFESGNYYQKLMQMLSRPSISLSLVISGLLALGFVTIISRNLTFINMVFQSVIRYVIYFISFLGGMWIGENRILPPALAIWLPNVVFLGYAIYLNRKVKT